MSRFGDPTIPRRTGFDSGNAKGRAASYKLGWGVFIERADGVVSLVDMVSGAKWSMEAVRMIGGMGGVQNLPRPQRYDAANNITVEGDPVVFGFLDGDPARPVILGAGLAAKADPEGYFDGQPLGTDPNRVAMRLNQIDSSNQRTGFVDVEVFPASNGKVEIRVGGSSFSSYTRIEVDGAAGTVKIGQGSEQPTVLADSFLADLAGVLAELQAVAAGIPLGAPVPSPNTAAMSAKLETYKTTVLKAE